MTFSLLVNMKMPTLVGIFILISRENFILNRVEHENNLEARFCLKWWPKPEAQLPEQPE